MSEQLPPTPIVTTSNADDASAWAPMRDRTFRNLWLVWVGSNVSMWMNDVAAAWVMTTLTTSPTLIALVQTASSLPVFLLGLPSGAAADIVDRRKYFMACQVWLASTALVIYLVAASGALRPFILLALVFMNGIGLAMRWPVYAAIIPELVPREQLSPALALNAVAVNFSRVAGPLVAGLVIASLGSKYVFALNFVMAVIAAFAISRWKRASTPQVLPGERFIGAMRLGWQYVRESQRMRDAIMRTSVFFLHATAIFALMPLVAKAFAGPAGGAGTYTVLLSCLGVGAITVATQLQRLRAHWNRDQLAFFGTVMTALSIGTLAIAPHEAVAGVAMVVAGSSWIMVGNSVTIAAQLALPDWIRARGMAIYQMSIMGGTALGAFIWGKVASLTSVPVSLAICAATLLVGLGLTRHRTLEGAEDLTPTHPFPEPIPAGEIDPHDGPVMITLEYLVDPARAVEFVSIMAESRSARLRQGAVSWGLFEDVQQPGRFLEYFACDSWADYLRRFDRFTAQDERLQEMRYAFHLGTAPPRISRYIAKHPDDRG
ncbi:MAG TPA: MFS transporter [Usitatibacter sp.]|jgi:MFS family permease|nr:MFS transporter [Usitatibacter sp.]